MALQKIKAPHPVEMVKLNVVNSRKIGVSTDRDHLVKGDGRSAHRTNLRNGGFFTAKGGYLLENGKHSGNSLQNALNCQCILSARLVGKNAAWINEADSVHKRFGKGKKRIPDFLGEVSFSFSSLLSPRKMWIDRVIAISFKKFLESG